MALAALIILDGEAPVAPVLGLSWPEFRMRRAVTAGALHLVLVTDRVTRDVVEAVDRLRGEGLSITLARSNADVADLFHPDEAVLLLTGSTIVGDQQLQAVLEAPKPVLLCIDPDRAGAGHELIDARSHWTGIARIDGGQIRATASMAGDWDLGSTLLRKLVAARAARITVSRDDLLVDASVPTGAAQASRALVASVGEQPRGWGERWIIGPLVGLAAQNLAAALPLLARFGPWTALLLFILAPLLQLRLWPSAAMGVFLIALLVAAGSRLASAATGIAVRGGRLPVHTRDAAAAVLLVLLVAQAVPDLTAVVLAIGLVALTALADRLIGDAATDAHWLADRAGHAIVLFAASFFGAAGLLAGLAICALHALATLAFLQNRLSRVLTSLR